jgi:hypothetical protein
MLAAMDLVRKLDDPYLKYAGSILDAQMYGSESPEFENIRARGIAELAKIESIVRQWVADHPEPTAEEGP